jgi:hypothetical protein
MIVVELLSLASHRSPNHNRARFISQNSKFELAGTYNIMQNCTYIYATRAPKGIP